MSAPGLSQWLEVIGVIAIGVAAMSGMAMMLCRRITSAAWRKTIWQATLVSSVLLALTEISGVGSATSMALGALFRVDTPGATHTTTAVVDDAVPGARSLATGSGPVEFPASAGGAGIDSPGCRLAAWWPGVVWTGGTLLLFGVILVSCVLSLAYGCGFRPCGDPAITEDVTRLAKRLGLRRQTRIVESESFAVPAVIGIIRQSLVLPVDFRTTLDREAREAVIAHELWHLVGADTAWMLFARLVRALLWWHPLVWLSVRRLRAVTEAAADDAASVVDDGPRLLAESLVRFGKRLHAGWAVNRVWIGIHDHRSDLARRVARLLSVSPGAWTRPGRLPHLLARGVGLGLAVLLVLGCTGWIRNSKTLGNSDMNTYRRSIASSILGMTLMTLHSVDAAEPGQTGAASVAPVRSKGDAAPPAMVVDTNAAAILISATFVELPTEKAPGILAGILDLQEGQLDDPTVPLRQPGLDWDKVCRGLSTNGCADVLSCPRVVTLDGLTAEMKVVSEIPRMPPPESTEGLESPTGDVSQVTMEEIGVSLTVTPRVSEDDRGIHLVLNATVKELAEGSESPARDGHREGETWSPPVIDTRSIDTTVVLNDGDTVLLGGVSKETTVHVEDRVPLLGAIPVIGALFSRTKQETRSRDLYVLVRAERTERIGE